MRSATALTAAAWPSADIRVSSPATTWRARLSRAVSNAMRLLLGAVTERVYRWGRGKVTQELSRARAQPSHIVRKTSGFVGPGRGLAGFGVWRITVLLGLWALLSAALYQFAHSYWASLSALAAAALFAAARLGPGP